MIRIFYNRKVLIYSLLWTLAMPAMVWSQYKESDFIRYTAREGLSSNYIYCLQQDELGYMWIGTDIGLNRFDGHSFRNFYQGSASLPLPSSIIRKIKKFDAGELGIITTRGFQVLNTKTYSLKNYFIPDSTSFSTYRNSIWDAMPLENGEYAVSSATGFYVFSRSGTIKYRYEAYHPEDVDKKRIFYARNIFQLNKQEQLVYVDEAGLAHYEKNKQLFREVSRKETKLGPFYPPPLEAGGGWVNYTQINNAEFIFIFHRKDSIVYYNHATGKRVSSKLPFNTFQELSWESKILQLTDSSFALNSGNAGFYIFFLDRNTGAIRCSPEKLFAGSKVNCLLLDKENRLWIGTSKGLLQQKLSVPSLVSYYYPPLPTDNSFYGFQSACRYKNKLYLSRLSNQNGLLIIDTATMQVEKRLEFYGKNHPANEILSIQQYYTDTLWLGTGDGPLWLDTKSLRYGKLFEEQKNPLLRGLASTSIFAPATPDGYAWFCYLMKGIVVRYHIPSRRYTIFTPTSLPALPFEKVKNIVYDSYGDVWISGHSLARWNNRLQQFDTLISVYGGTNKFNDDIVTISADQRGSLWLHNAENGLLEYKIKERRFVPFDRKTGLPSDIIACLSPVVNDMLWIGSPNHLTQFNTLTHKSISYDFRDGLPEESSRARKIYYDSATGKCYLFRIDNLVVFPAIGDKRKMQDNELLIQELSINNGTTIFHPADSIRLKHFENNLAIQTTLVDFESSNAYMLEYKLDNAPGWSSLGNQRNIYLNGLPSGNLLLQLRATGKSGRQQTKEFHILIAPPFWKTNWFLISCTALLALLIIILFRKRISSIRKEANISKQLAEFEMKALHAQMNPHFIFNSLNSIKEMILEDQKHNASRYLSKFAQLIRTSLDQSRQTFISLQQNIEHLEYYLEMEQVRFADFDYYIEVQEDLHTHEIKMAPMLIQPIVENAIWHGLMSKQGKKNLYLRFYAKNKELVCEIEDNGIGINASIKNKAGSRASHRSLGIDNIRQRIAVLNEKYNIQYRLEIKDKQSLGNNKESGTIAIISLPLENNATMN